MAALKMTVTPRRDQVLAREELWVDVTLTNTGDQPVDVPDPECAAPLPVVFVFDPVAGGDRVAATQAGYEAFLTGDDIMPRARMETRTLAPGEAASMSHDLALYTLGALRPGRYTLAARHEALGLAAPAVELEVVQPGVQMMHSVLCPMQLEVATVFEHLCDDDRIVLFQQGLMDLAPASAAFVRRRELDFTAPLEALAVAVQPEAWADGRWFAWIQAEHICAMRGFDGSVTSGQIDPQLTALRQPGLARPGFHMSSGGGQGVFLAHGRDTQGWTCVQQFHFTRDTITPGPDVPLCRGELGQMIARCEHLGGASWRQQVVWSELDPAPVRACQLDAEGKPLDAPHDLFHTWRGPAVCMEMFPVGPGDQAVAHVLCGPGSDGHTMSYLRLPLAQGAAKEEWTFQAPDQPVEAWAISGLPGGGLPVVAFAGGQLLTTSAMSGAGWSLLFDQLPAVGNLQLLVTPEADYLVSWYSPLEGLQFYPLMTGGHP